MKPYCSRCYTTNPETAETDQGYHVHWFKVSEGEEEELEYLGVDEKGEFTMMFMAIVEKDFDYDSSFKLMCPDCVVEIMKERNKKDKDASPGSVNSGGDVPF